MGQSTSSVRSAPIRCNPDNSMRIQEQVRHTGCSARELNTLQAGRNRSERTRIEHTHIAAEVMKALRATPPIASLVSEQRRDQPVEPRGPGTRRAAEARRAASETSASVSLVTSRGPFQEPSLGSSSSRLSFSMWALPQTGEAFRLCRHKGCVANNHDASQNTKMLTL